MPAVWQASDRDLLFKNLLIELDVLQASNGPNIEDHAAVALERARSFGLGPKSLVYAVSWASRQKELAPPSPSAARWRAGGTSLIPMVEDLYRGLFARAEIVRPPNCQESVVAGLALETAYDSLNLHRPDFDIVLVRGDGRVETLYSAFQPLCERQQILRGESNLGHRVVLKALGDCGEDVQLRLQDLNGNVLKLVSESQGARVSSSLRLVLAPWQDAYIKLYVDGRLVISTGFGTETLRMSAWPVTAGGRQPDIRLDDVSRGLRRLFDHHGTPGEPG